MPSNSYTHAPPAEPDRKPVLLMVALSAAIASFLIWLIYFKGKVATPDWVGALPAPTRHSIL